MPTIRKNMADINSSDQALNGLKVKTDALPNDWYVTLVNPQTGEPGENMSIARFVELFTPKQPEATITNKGILSTEMYKHIMSKYKSYNNGTEAYAVKIKTNLKVVQYGSYYFYCRIGQTQNGGICNQIIHLNIRLWSYHFVDTAPISLGQNVIEDVVVCEENDGYITIYVDLKNKRLLYGGVTDLLFRYHGDSNSIVSVEFLSEKYVPGSHSNEIITTISNPSSFSLSPNALTETIVEEVPVSADTPMTLEETGQPAPTTQTVERYEYSIPKMAEAILALQKEIAELKGGAGKE